MRWVFLVKERKHWKWEPSLEARGGSGQADALGSGTRPCPVRPPSRDFIQPAPPVPWCWRGWGAPIKWSGRTAGHHISPDIGLCGR